MSDRPLLGDVRGTRQSGHSKRRTGASLLFMNILRGGMVAPSSTTYDSVYIILNTADPEERDERTKTWMNHKLEELNFVGVVGGLISGCLTSTGSWPDILSNGEDKPWSVKAFWYSGIIFALLAVLIAMQQGLRLHRLSAHRDGLELIRRSMAQDGQAKGSGTPASDAAIRPRSMQIYAWQASLTFLVVAVICLIIGMLVLVWASAGYGPKKRPEDGWWDQNAYLALIFTIVVAFSTLVFIVAQSSLATELQDER
ncbi:hypothetical protein F5Y19DRAFT_208624 [Xylariaceae sp. FL1651]|nr:hypothetical protein F5Y19DRAFT_208624 [Xylariaceae sp. FL1651]